MLDEVLGKPRTPDPEDAPSSSGAPSTTGQEHEIAVPPSPSGSTNSFETAVSTMSAAVPASATTRVPEPAGILCLGIGSIKDNRVAQLQLVLLLIMSERIAVSFVAPSPHLISSRLVLSGSQLTPRHFLETLDPFFSLSCSN